MANRMEFEFESSLPGIGIDGSRKHWHLVAEYEVTMDRDIPTIKADDVRFYVECSEPSIMYRKEEIENVITMGQWRALKAEMIAQWKREQEETE